VSAGTRLRELLPSPYAIETGAVMGRLLDVVGLELDAVQEDLERVQQAHWIRTAARLFDVEKLGALVGIRRLPWETRDLFRERVLALVVARRHGAIGPHEVRRFVFDYVRSAERATGCTLVPGLEGLDLAEAYQPVRPRFRPLRLVENPVHRRSSTALEARSGRVPYLFRWEEANRGLDETFVTVTITGAAPGVTVVPILANRTTGDLLGYAAALGFGRRLVVAPAPTATAAAPRLAAASLDGRDVSADLFSLAGFRLGVPFTRAELDPAPRLPRLARGVNEWVFLSVGLHDVRGLDRFHFAIAGEDLREGVFDETRLDQALFPAGVRAQLSLQWDESEPASFRVEVPRHVTVEPAGLEVDGRPVHAHVADTLVASLGELHAAGVRAQVRFRPFSERQPHHVSCRLTTMVLDPERAPAGSDDRVTLGGRFGESSLGGSRFE
jgi:hypothetical protein